MGELVLQDAHVRVGSSQSTTNLTPWVTGVTINYAAELHDKTAMGTNSRSRIAGLKDWSVTIDFNQDFGTNMVDYTLFNLVGIANSSQSTLIIKPTTVKGSATNPRYKGRGLLESYSPLSGAVGELAKVPVTFQGDGDLSRLDTSGLS